MKTWEGLLDRVKFPGQLSAVVVEPGADPRVHGYAVQGELGHSVDFLQVAWLSLTGELPGAAEREAFSRALVWLAPLHVGEGPAHAAVLARVAGAPDQMVPAIGVIALGQLISHELETCAPLFAWLSTREGAAPPEVLEPEPTEAQQAAWSRLTADATRWFGASHPFTGAPWRRVPAAYALLHALGLRDAPRLQTLATMARLPVMLAEAACTAPGSVMRYPTGTPGYRYVEGV